MAGDVPCPGDFDGDGKFDAAIWRPSEVRWYISGSTSGFQSMQFGSLGDIPAPGMRSVE